MTHEDDRRKLVEFGESDIWKVCKVVFIKKDSELGDHYHKIKTESFMLVKGSGNCVINGKWERMEIGKEYLVKPKYMHSFELKKGSILIGLCSEKFNPKDDYTERT